jgi:hypothetical protein
MTSVDFFASTIDPYSKKASAPLRFRRATSMARALLPETRESWASRAFTSGMTVSSFASSMQVA